MDTEMKLDRKNAWKLRFPRFSYTNYNKQYYNKQYPGMEAMKRKWLRLERFWMGRIWIIGIRHHEIKIDFRRSWIDDMVFPGENKRFKR